MDLDLYEKYNYVQRQSVEIILNSKNGTNLNNLDGHKIFLLEQEIASRKDERMLLHLKKAFIPFSFYTLSSSQRNNKLDIKETHSNGTDTNTYSITIPDGNYNITELLAKIKTLLEAGSAYNHTYTITYDTQTAKVTFIELEPQGSNIKAELLFASGNNANDSCRRLLGFDAVDVEFTSSVSVSSQNIVDMADGLDSIHIKSNLVGTNIRSTDAEGGELLLVPVDLEPFSILYYAEGALPFKHLLNQDNIKRIEIKMTDVNDNIIDFNNIPYTLILQVDFVFNPSTTLNVDNKELDENNSLRKMVETNEKLAREIIKKNKK